ncbi:MAG TPA: MFS transporter [candidate division Zixibacteria bacterium]|nr:MFS transporter [candidate division Zixibacteria bacterium]
MKARTFKLLLPLIAVTVQSNSATTIIPPFLDELRVPVAGIGTLVSLGPIFALASRLPIGMIYERGRARLLIVASVLTMGATNFAYSLASDALTFAIVQALNGFAYGALTTSYMAFYVESLPPEENRNHAMGYYVGTLAVGYSTGNFFGGWFADRFGYDSTFQAAAFLSLVPCVLLWRLHVPEGPAKRGGAKAAGAGVRGSWRALLEPELATVAAVALILNLLHQMGGVFISLYGLSVGMSLTQIGAIRAAYAGCNAITRPISGHVVNRVGHRGLSYAGIPLQSAILMTIPLFTGFGAIMTAYVSSGLMRAIVIVANAVGLVQDVDENRVRRGVASGVYNAAGDLGNILGPAVGGLIAHAAGIGGVFVAGSAGATLLFLFLMGAVRRLRRAAPAAEPS